MTIEDSKIIEWLAGITMALGSLLVACGWHLVRNRVNKLEELEKYTSKLARIIVTRKEYSELLDRIAATEAENLALRMSAEDNKTYKVVKHGETGWAITEVENEK